MLLIGIEAEALVSLQLASELPPNNRSCSISETAISQIQEYFSGSRKVFDLPLSPKGTPFQKLVWQELRRIPYGEVRTYGQIAAAIGHPKAARAVGQAANRNPLWILIPCHRVVGKNGNLTGYAGGLTMKQTLLELEQLHKNSPEAP